MLASEIIISSFLCQQSVLIILTVVKQGVLR